MSGVQIWLNGPQTAEEAGVFLREYAFLLVPSVIPFAEGSLTVEAIEAKHPLNKVEWWEGMLEWVTEGCPDGGLSQFGEDFEQKAVGVVRDQMKLLQSAEVSVKVQDGNVARRLRISFEADVDLNIKMTALDFMKDGQAPGGMLPASSYPLKPEQRMSIAKKAAPQIMDAAVNIGFGAADLPEWPSLYEAENTLDTVLSEAPPLYGIELLD